MAAALRVLQWQRAQVKAETGSIVAQESNVVRLARVPFGQDILRQRSQPDVSRPSEERAVSAGLPVVDFFTLLPPQSI